MIKTYRTGAIGALLDIYEQAIAELKATIQDISDEYLIIITDPHTNNENCRSIQTILTHVVHSGFGYATSIYNLKGHQVIRPGKVFHPAVAQYLVGLDELFDYTEVVFGQLNEDDLEQNDAALKILTGWGQLYDIEQLMEHAIVHILRHKRQIERVLLSISNKPTGKEQ